MLADITELDERRRMALIHPEHRVGRSVFEYMSNGLLKRALPKSWFPQARGLQALCY